MIWKTVFAIFFSCTYLYSWESHYLLTYEALRGMSGISEKPIIESETLENFVNAEKDGLSQLLHQTELLSARSLLDYPAFPKELRFSTKTKQDLNLTKQFLMALRINPDLKYPLFILKELGANKDQSFSLEEIKEASLETLAKIDSGQALKKVIVGQKLSPLEIIATASEEPDHGLDLHLWSDNNSWFGSIYNFGTQPFGNPLLSFSSQAPFHMGFFHESTILYAAGGFLKRCYPEYRINQFMALSRFAFAKGHPYWGYRFLGIALHYLQDLTQVYHATVAPGQSAAKLIGINLLSMIGLDKFKREMTQVLSNKHLGFESYQLGYIKNALKKAQAESPVLKALKDTGGDQNYGAFSETYARLVIAKESHDKASLIDELIKKALPSRLFNPTFNFDIDEKGVDLYIEVTKKANNDIAKLDEALLANMRAFGAHTRQGVRYALGIY